MGQEVGQKLSNLHSQKERLGVIPSAISRKAWAFWAVVGSRVAECTGQSGGALPGQIHDSWIWVVVCVV